MQTEKKVDVIVDLQYGSTGKGLIAGYLAETVGYDTVVSANMPNAGHTYINAEGRKWVHKVLPNGIVSPNLKAVMIGPGSVFSLGRLQEEISNSIDIFADTGASLVIHENAAVLSDHHVLKEQRSLNSISSTMQGSAAASVEKMMRDKESNIIAADRILGIMAAAEGAGLKAHQVLIVSQRRWLAQLYEAGNILLEGAQGYSLGLNAGFWPHCTSRDCTPARFMSDCGIPLGMLRKVIGTARVHPIRVGNTEGGFSGDTYQDQTELSWSELGLNEEYTTVTGRVRRVFSFSANQIVEAIMACQPREVFLNFMNYDPLLGERLVSFINDQLQEYVPGGGSVRYTGWGASFTDVRERNFTNPCDYTKQQTEKGWVK